MEQRSEGEETSAYLNKDGRANVWSHTAQRVSEVCGDGLLGFEDKASHENSLRGVGSVDDSVWLVDSWVASSSLSSQLSLGTWAYCTVEATEGGVA